MASWLLTLGIILIIAAVVLSLLGWVAWKIGKWLIIIFIIVALIGWLLSIL